VSAIKECFETRFESGALVEMDYSQLEVIGLAVLCGDPVLKNDIRSGIDMHCQNAADLYNEGYTVVKLWVAAGDPEWIKKRKLAKAFSFALQYGAGAKSLSEDNGVPLKLAKKFIANYYDRYPGIKTWQEQNIELVGISATPSGRKTPKGYPTMVGHLDMPTGRRYEFEEYDAPDFLVEKGIHTSFSPTQIKNYPVQGLAGELMKIMLHDFYMALQRNENILLINTVHDSVVFDLKDEREVRYLVYICNRVIKRLPTLFSKYFSLNFNVPIKGELSVGESWGDLKEVSLDKRS
jgi:DNA polymerase I-like protein with 3'-5' exonuclease and polymerase domains